MTEERQKINLLVENLIDNLKDFATQMQDLKNTSERNFVDFSCVMINNFYTIEKVLGVYKTVFTDVLKYKDDLSKVENILNEIIGN